MVAQALRKWLAKLGTETLYIAPGSPWCGFEPKQPAFLALSLRQEPVPHDHLAAKRGAVVHPLLASQQGCGMRVRDEAVGGEVVCRIDDEPLIAEPLEAGFECVEA